MPPLLFFVAVLAALGNATLFPVEWIHKAKVMCGSKFQSDMAITLRHNLRQQLGLNAYDAEKVVSYGERQSAIALYEHALEDDKTVAGSAWPTRTLSLMSEGKRPVLPRSCYGAPEVLDSSPAAARGNIVRMSRDSHCFYSSVGFAVGLTGVQMRLETARFVTTNWDKNVAGLKGATRTRLRDHIAKGERPPKAFLRGLGGFGYADDIAGDIVAAMLGAYISVDPGSAAFSKRSFGDVMVKHQIMLHIDGSDYSSIERNIPWRFLSETTALLRCTAKGNDSLTDPLVGPTATGVGAVWQLLAAAERRLRRIEGKAWSSARTPPQIYSQLAASKVSKPVKAECPEAEELNHVLAGGAAGTGDGFIVQEELVHLHEWAKGLHVGVSIFSPPPSPGASPVRIANLGDERGYRRIPTRPEFLFVVSHLINSVDMLHKGQLGTKWQLLDAEPPQRHAVFDSQDRAVGASDDSLASVMVQYFAPHQSLSAAFERWASLYMTANTLPTREQEGAVVLGVLPSDMRVELFAQEEKPRGTDRYEHLDTISQREWTETQRVVQVVEKTLPRVEWEEPEAPRRSTFVLFDPVKIADTRHDEDGADTRHDEDGADTRHDEDGADTRHDEDGADTRHDEDGADTRHDEDGARFV